MKTLILLGMILSSAVYADVIKVDVKAGYNAVKVSSSFMASGCSHKTQYLDVVKTTEGYATGQNIAIKHDKEVWKDLMPKIEQPQSICKAMVRYTTVARFTHYASSDETISVDFPIMPMSNPVDVSVEEVKVVH